MVNFTRIHLAPAAKRPAVEPRVSFPPRQKKARKDLKIALIRIPILQSSTIATALYVLMGFIYAAIATPMLIFGNEKLKILAIIYILMPIIIGIFGFIFFVIFAAICNLLAKWFGGGIEVEV
jgi:hypothetical protein